VRRVIDDDASEQQANICEPHAGALRGGVNVYVGLHDKPDLFEHLFNHCDLIGGKVSLPNTLLSLHRFSGSLSYPGPVGPPPMFPWRPEGASDRPMTIAPEWSLLEQFRLRQLPTGFATVIACPIGGNAQNVAQKVCLVSFYGHLGVGR